MQQHTAGPQRLPDRCPRHPDSGMALTKTVSTGSAAGPHMLTQHRCGEPGCPEGAGWMYSSPENTVISGPGLCQDQELLDRIDQAAHEHLVNGAYGMILVMTLFAGGGTWMYLSFSQDQLWSLNHTAAALILPVATAALTWATRLVLRAKAPRGIARPE